MILFMLAHREADGQVELHETQADVFFRGVGSATLVVGGTLKGGETTAPHEKRNGTIEAARGKKLSAGDVVRFREHAASIATGWREGVYVLRDQN